MPNHYTFRKEEGTGNKTICCLSRISRPPLTNHISLVVDHHSQIFKYLVHIQDICLKGRFERFIIFPTLPQPHLLFRESYLGGGGIKCINTLWWPGSKELQAELNFTMELYCPSPSC